MKAEFVSRAKLSEQAERYDDMAEYMRKVTESGLGIFLHFIIDIYFFLYRIGQWGKKLIVCCLQERCRCQTILMENYFLNRTKVRKGWKEGRKWNSSIPRTIYSLYNIGYRQRIPWKGRKGTPRNLRSCFGSPWQTFDPKSFIRWIQSFLLENEGWLFPIFGWSRYRTKEKGHHERVTRSLQGCLRSCPEGNASK